MSAHVENLFLFFHIGTGTYIFWVPRAQNGNSRRDAAARDGRSAGGAGGGVRGDSAANSGGLCSLVFKILLAIMLAGGAAMISMLWWALRIQIIWIRIVFTGTVTLDLRSSRFRSNPLQSVVLRNIIFSQTYRKFMREKKSNFLRKVRKKCKQF